MNKLLYTMQVVCYSFPIMICAISAPSFAQSPQAKEIIRNVLAQVAAARGYEVEVAREKSWWATTGTFSELRGKPKAQIMEEGQKKRSLRYKAIRTKDAKIEHRIIRKPAAKKSKLSKGPAREEPQGPVSQNQTDTQDEQEALFTVSPEDLFSKYEESEVTELSRTGDQVVLKVGPPPGPAPADWPDMWLRATFDSKRDVLLKSELIVEGEARIIADFAYQLVEDKHWLPAQKTIRIIEKDAVTVIEDNFGSYQKSRN